MNTGENNIGVLGIGQWLRSEQSQPNISETGLPSSPSVIQGGYHRGQRKKSFIRYTVMDSSGSSGVESIKFSAKQLVEWGKKNGLLTVKNQQ